MKQPKPLLIQKQLSSIYPDEIRFSSKEQMFEAFGVPFDARFSTLYVSFECDEKPYRTKYSLVLSGSRIETPEEMAKRLEKDKKEQQKFKALQEAEKEKQKQKDLKELARLKKKYEQ